MDKKKIDEKKLDEVSGGLAGSKFTLVMGKCKACGYNGGNLVPLNKIAKCPKCDAGYGQYEFIAI